MASRENLLVVTTVVQFFSIKFILGEEVSRVLAWTCSMTQLEKDLVVKWIVLQKIIYMPCQITAVNQQLQPIILSIDQRVVHQWQIHAIIKGRGNVTKVRVDIV